MARSNIALIGMPGAGKSTVGVLLAKHLGKAFMDTDLLIQSQEGRTLQEIVDRQGHLALREIEERVLSELEVANTVIATGGSAAYSERAMDALRRQAVIVYLHVSLPEIEARVHDMGSRGLAKSADQTLADLYAERTPLYQRHAELTVDCTAGPQERAVEAIIRAVSRAAPE